MEHTVNDPVKLTIPIQTNISHWVIVISIWSVFILALIGGSTVSMLPVALSIFILPLYAFLARPERDRLRDEDLIATAQLNENGTLPRVQSYIEQLTEEVEFTGSIRLLISKQPNAIHAVGTWRRHYLFLGSNVARQIDADLQTADNQAIVKSLLLHEIAHFAHRDIRRIGYVRELLRSCFIIPLWWTLFTIAWLSLSFAAGEAIVNFDLRQIPDADPLLISLG